MTGLPDPPSLPLGPTKRCKTCGLVKGVGEFNSNPRLRDGLVNECKACRSARSRARYEDVKHTPGYKERVREFARQKRKKRRDAALAILGDACVCCGQTRSVFLQIDHINGGGNAHRRAIVGGATGSSSINTWVTRNPEEARAKLQILCANCNAAKEIEESHICP